MSQKCGAAATSNAGGCDEAAALARGLLRLLADTFVLLYKTRYGVWHAPEAPALRDALRRDHHTLNASGEALAAAVRELGGAIPASYADLARFSSGDEDPVACPVESWTARIAADHTRVAADAAMLLLMFARTTDAQVVALLRGLRAQHLRAARSLDRESL